MTIDDVPRVHSQPRALAATERMVVGNAYLSGLWKGCPSFGSKVPTSSEQSIRTQRVNSLQTVRWEELRIDSVNLAEGGAMAVMVRASERITPPNRSVSAK